MRSVQQAIDHALFHLRANRLLEAQAVCQSVLKSHPDHFDALQLQGLVYLHLGNCRSAIEFMAEALRINPMVSSVHTNLGEAYRQMNRLDDAIACYARAISLKPEAAAAHNNLGLALFDKGDLARATDCFEKALAIDPKMLAALANLGRTHLCRNNLFVGLYMTLKESGLIRFANHPRLQIIPEF